MTKAGKLSPREQQVVALLCDGLSNIEICERLGITRRTLEAHIAHVSWGWRLDRPLRHELLARQTAELNRLQTAS